MLVLRILGWLPRFLTPGRWDERQVATEDIQVGVSVHLQSGLKIQIREFGLNLCLITCGLFFWGATGVTYV